MCLSRPHLEEKLGPRLGLKATLSCGSQPTMCIESEPDGQLILKRQIPGPSLGNSGSVGFVVGPQNLHFKEASGVSSDADGTWTMLWKRLSLKSLMILMY